VGRLYHILCSRTPFLVSKINKCLEAGAQSTSTDADPVTLRFIQRRYTSFSSHPVKKPNVFYGFHFGHVPGVYATWKEAQLQSIEVTSDFRCFKTREQAEASVTLDCARPLLPSLPGCGPVYVSLLGAYSHAVGSSRHCSTGLTMARSRPTQNQSTLSRVELGSRLHCFSGTRTAEERLFATPSNTCATQRSNGFLESLLGAHERAMSDMISPTRVSKLTHQGTPRQTYLLIVNSLCMAQLPA